MILRLYRSIGLGSVLISIITGILLWLNAFVNSQYSSVPQSENDMPLYSLVAPFLSSQPLIATILAFVFIIIIALYLTNFNTKFFFITERTLLPTSLYIILSSFFVELQHFQPIIPAVLLFLISLSRLFSSYRKSGVAYSFLDAGILLGLASFFYFNIIWFLPILIIGIFIIRTFSLKETFLTISGLLTPYVIMGAIYHLRDNDINMFLLEIQKNITIPQAALTLSTYEIVLTAITATIFLITLIHLFGIFNTKKIRAIKIYWVFIWILLICVSAFYLVPSSSFELYYILLIPCVYIIAHFIVVFRNKKIANLVFTLILLISIALQAVDYFLKIL